MAKSDFVPFATGAGANTYALGTYQGAAARQSGVVPGQANARLANNAWRQGTVMAAAVGQFIADLGYDALDDGDIETLTANLKDALKDVAIDAVPTTAVIHVGGETSTTVNALTVPTVTPDITTLADFQAFLFAPNLSVTGPASLRIKTFPALPLLRRDGGQMAEGDGPAGHPMLVVKIGSAYRAIGLVASQVSVTVRQVLKNTVIVGGRLYIPDGPGTYTFNLPSDVTAFGFDLWGAGGGAGGATGNGTTAASSGGGGGDYEAGSFACLPGSPINITVGAGGTGGAATGADGTNGGLSSITYRKPDGTTATITALGGRLSRGATSGPNYTEGAGGTGSGGLDSRTGSRGGTPYQIFNGTFIGGAGGGSYSSAPTPPNAGAAGSPGSFPGGGGAGSSGNAATGNGSEGGYGADGKCVIRY